MEKPPGIKKSEVGFAALIISIVLVIVLSLITVGFAALMRTEQQAALNRQLNNSASYAAESGINDAVQAVTAGFDVSKQVCGTLTAAQLATLPSAAQTAYNQYLTTPTIDTNAGTSVSCLLIEPNPSTLEYSSIDVGAPTTVVATGSDTTGADKPIYTLVFSWQDANGGAQFTPAGSYSANGNSWFPPAAQWTSGSNAITGLLRTSLTPLPTGVLNRDILNNSTYTAFLYPEPGATASTANTTVDTVAVSSSYNSTITNPTGGNTGSRSGEILNGHCNLNSAPRYCQVAIDVSSQGAAGITTYLLHLSSVYKTTEVTVTAYGQGGVPLYIKGAQTLIDSTGKAQGVLKRIEVRIPARKSFDYPEFDLETAGNVCKQLSAYPPNAATGKGLASNSCDPL